MANIHPEMSAWKDTVLKIQIHDEVRRIPVERIVDLNEEKESYLAPSLSFAKLIKYVIEYARILETDGTPNNDTASIKLFYLDEEDEEIVISTNLELFEAIMSLHRSPKSKENSWTLETEEPETSKDYSKQLDNKYVLRMRATVEHKLQNKTATPAFTSFPPMFDKMSQIPMHHESSTKLPTGVVVIDTIFSIVANFLDTFHQSQNGRNKVYSTTKDFAKIPPPEFTTVGKDHSSFNTDFVHGRHSCDNCRIKPIIGYRYHSTTKPNYDLCHQCFSEKCDKGMSDEDLTSFQLAQHNPDRFFKRQKSTHRWLKPYTGKRRREFMAEELSDVIVNEKIIQKCLNEIKEKKNSIDTSNININNADVLENMNISKRENNEYPENFEQIKASIETSNSHDNDDYVLADNDSLQKEKDNTIDSLHEEITFEVCSQNEMEDEFSLASDQNSQVSNFEEISATENVVKDEKVETQESEDLDTLIELAENELEQMTKLNIDYQELEALSHVSDVKSEDDNVSEPELVDEDEIVEFALENMKYSPIEFEPDEALESEQPVNEVHVIADDDSSCEFISEAESFDKYTYNGDRSQNDSDSLAGDDWDIVDSDDDDFIACDM